MSANFKIVSKKINGSSLVLHLSGDFDGTSAWKLIDTIMVRYNGNGEVVIHIENLRNAFPFGVSLLENLLTETVVPLQQVLFVDGKCIVRGREEIRLFSQEKSHRLRSRCSCDGMCAECGCGHSKRSFKTARSA